jgi:Holliday junction resolvase RusA-like endonuclease
MTSVSFTIPGPPKGKARPRVVSGHAFTPNDTVVYENAVRMAYKAAGGGMMEGPLAMVVIACFQPPKSVSKKKLAAMLAGEIRPTKKPDTDNVLKIVADALNGVAYRDDAEIVSAHVAKVYEREPRVIVRVFKIADADEADKIFHKAVGE